MSNTIKSEGFHVGNEFVARKSYPFFKRGMAPKDEDFSYDIQTGEKVRVESYEDGLYKLVNLSLDEGGLAWVTVSEEDLLRLKRIQADTGQGELV